MASPAFVQSSSTFAVGISSSPYTPSYPAGMTTGNFLILVANVLETAGSATVTPSGFTALTSFTYTVAGGNCQIFWRRITGSEGATASLAFSGTIYPTIDFLEFSGVVASPASPIDGTPAAPAEVAGAAVSYAAAAYTTLLASSTLIDVFSNINGSDISFTAGRGTKRTDNFDTGGSQGTAVATKAIAAAGTEAAANWSFASSTHNRGCSFAIASLAASTTWNGASTVSLTATITTAGTASTPTIPLLALVPRPPDSLTLVPVTTPLTTLTLSPR